MLDVEKRDDPLVLDLLARIEALEARVAELEAEDDEGTDETYSAADLQEAIRAKGGEVGTLTGPPIIGTNDSVNAGPAKKSPGWKPAGEVGFIIDSGVSVVEEPKNNARPVVKRVGPPS